MTGKTKKILGAVVAIAVIGAVVGFSVNRENRKKTTVQTGKIEKKDLVPVVTASGEVRPKRYVNVGANVSGTHHRRSSCRRATGCEKGQTLARIESERYEAMERQSEAGVAAAARRPRPRRGRPRGLQAHLRPERRRCAPTSSSRSRPTTRPRPSSR